MPTHRAVRTPADSYLVTASSPTEAETQLRVFRSEKHILVLFKQPTSLPLRLEAETTRCVTEDKSVRLRIRT